VIKPQFHHFGTNSNSSQQKRGDLGSALHCPNSAPQYLAPDRDPRAADKSQNISETHARKFGTATPELRWKPPENSVEQPARRRDARACRCERGGAGTNRLCSKAMKGRALAFISRGVGHPAPPPPYQHHPPPRLPGRLRPVAWRPRRIPRRRPVALAYGWQKRRAAKRTGVGARTRGVGDPIIIVLLLSALLVSCCEI